MKKRIYSTAVALTTLAVSLSFVSCDIFEGDGFGDRNVGNLEREFRGKDLPAGYRIKSVGEIRYFYKSTGKLDYIRMGGVEFDLEKKSFSHESERGIEKYSFSFNTDNNLKKMKMSYRPKEGEEEGEATYEFTYNSDKQLTGITGSLSGTFIEEGEKVRRKNTTDIEISYNRMCIERIRMKSEDRETVGGETEKDIVRSTIAFSYDEDDEFYNRYFQWTPKVLKYGLDSEDDDLISALAYAGMLGRASRLLPEKLSIENDDDDFKTYCSYEHNSYHAISHADGVRYTYTEKEDDYEVKPFVNPDTRSPKPATRSRLFRYNPFVFRR